MKKCKQCGLIKPLTQYRANYNRPGTCNTCRSCESVNSRVKYLKRKTKLSDAEALELTSIYKLWDSQRAQGLRPPSAPGYQAVLITPVELDTWLTCDLTATPEHYQDVVYEQLMATYRPILSIDPMTGKRTYDDTYKDKMDLIAARFDAYEDAYYDV